ncbi:MAG TPA: CHAT domain-containing protein [Micromonosporaceae bacterium]|nr:CHAT domain-containing protein [Micromonosporaceae bacterium]
MPALMLAPAPASPTGDVDWALVNVMADPRRARATAEAALEAARRRHDPNEQMRAERVLGLAARELHNAAQAAVHLRRSVRIGELHGLGERTAESRMSLALVEEDLGRPHAAIRAIDRAIADLRGLPLARARMQRALILRRLGRETEALAGYGAALAAFRRWDDRLWQARALMNRGVLHALRGALRHADADLRRAERLYAELELPAAVAHVRHNRGFVAAQAGDVSRALTWYDRADEQFRRDGPPVAALLDRAELLLAARLLPEARQAALVAVQACAGGRLGSLLPQARLLVARAALAAGDTRAAGPYARAARREFRRQGRGRWAVLADYLDWLGTGRAGLAAARRIARSLAEAGWAEEAVEARLHAVELAGALNGRAARGSRRARGASGASPAAASERSARDAAVAELAEAAGLVRRGPVRLRVRAWHATAVVRLHAGDRPGASRALRQGLRLLDEYRAALGATELRVHSSADGHDLAVLGLRLAVADGRPREVLAWAEQWRAATLRLPPPPPSYGDALARDLAKLRRVRAELAAADGEPARLRRLTARQRALEDAVRRASWRATGGTGARTASPSIGAVCAGLGDRALVELVELDGELLALVVAGGRVRQYQLSRMDTVEPEVTALRFALRRLAMGYGSRASLDAAELGARHAACRLDELLLMPVRRQVGDRPLVIVPTGALHGIPWAVLPSCRGRPVVVAPSATAWWRAARTSATVDGPVVLVAAETPPHAMPEVATIAAGLPEAVTLVGDRARVVDVLGHLDGAGVAHLATHGEFRADNPLFSHLLLADGPLTGYDLMRLRRPPALTVLSACDAGLSAVHPGDELMGFASAMLGLGARTLVASLGPVDDEATVTLMVDLHRRLYAGTPPAEALAGAQAASTGSVVNFVCLGAG